jgi:hypothetical protein
MKKLAVIMIAAVFVFGAAANAMAATSYEMYFSMYGFKDANGVNQNGRSENKTFGDKEATYNLGFPTDMSYNELFAPGGAKDGAHIDTGIFISDLTSTGVNSWGDIQLALHCSFGNPGNFPAAGAYFGAIGTPMLNHPSQQGFDSASSNIALGLPTPEAGLNNVHFTNNPNSYVTQLNYGIIGTLGFFVDSQNSELNLGALDTQGGTAELRLYKAAYPTAVIQTPVMLGTFTFALDVNDQSLVANYNAVPVPAPLMLLGAGLLGLIGFRRKNA